MVNDRYLNRINGWLIARIGDVRKRIMKIAGASAADRGVTLAVGEAGRC
jgi:hypothetical protein